MFHRAALFALVPVSLVAAAPDAPPEKALKYHEALMKRPHNAALFDRFFGAWIDEQPVESLGVFLTERAVKNGGQDWTVLALYQLRRGQEDGALESLGKAIEAVPEDPALAMDRAKLRMRRMEFTAARKDLAAVVAAKDEALALEAAKLLGKSWLREGKSEEAIKAWDAVLAAHPGDEDLLEDLVEAAAAEGETEQALTYVGKLIEASKDPYQKTLRSLRRGDLLAQSGKNDEAVEAYAATLTQVGEGSWLEREVLAQIEKVFRKQDRLDGLTAELSKLAEANPRRLLIHRQLAKLEAGQGDVDAAIGRFREVLKRSPGDRELREEFVRLLTDGERFDDASAELEKLIETAPTESGLYLQLAALRSRQAKPEQVLAALKKAHELVGKDESAGIRIAGLMLQYGLNDQGETLLKEVAAVPGAGSAAVEALAAQYGRTNRKTEAVELLKKVGTSDDVDVVIRATAAISALGESATAYQALVAKGEKFASEPRYLVAVAQSALAAGKAADAVPQAVKLVRLAKQTTELAEAIGLADRVIAAADKGLEWSKTLEAQASRSASETCLLASLLDAQGDVAAVGKLLEKSTDPLVVHFHAALLDRRGDFDTAIVVLARLADTDEGRKAAYFKDLAELQQRAGKTEDAIATVERWKQSAPGDKTAWTMASRLLRENGKTEDAVKVARQAAARFEGDVDLAASLASLQDESGQWADAEAIYWRLYDEAQSPTDQARWAAQLAQLASKNGRVDELEEKLKERAKGNRRSLGPILAQAELARVMQNEDKRRDLLLEAVRIQPKDLDLRLQISALEDKAGNQDRVVAVLEEALPYDNANRVRAALAQAYLRQGQALKGLREMRAMSGKKAGDPRSVEDSAASLAAAKMYDEAIRFMREELPDGGDWRSKYLLATMLEEDGRETEALPLFIGLMQAQGEIPSLAAAATAAANSPYNQRSRYEGFGTDAAKLLEMGASSQAAYMHKKDGRQYGYMMGGRGALTGPFKLPDTPEEVRTYALVHLCKLAKKDRDGELDPAVMTMAKAAGVTNIEFASTFFAQFGDEDGNPDFVALLEKFPDEPGLMEVAGIYGRGVPVETARKVLEKSDKLSPIARFNALVRVLSADGEKADDKYWNLLVATARESLGSKDDYVRSNASYQVLGMLVSVEGQVRRGNQAISVPDARKEELKRAVMEQLVPKLGADLDELALRLGAFSVAGTTEQWIGAINQGLKDFRAQPPSKKAGNVAGGRSAYARIMQYGRYGASFGGGYNPWGSENPFELPRVDTAPLSSLPYVISSQIKQSGSDSSMYATFGRALEVDEAKKYLDRFESPLMRAWIALSGGDDATVAKALAVEPPKEEVADFEVLRALQAIKQKNMADAWAALEKARTLGGADRDFVMWLNVSMVAVAGEMTAEERSKVTDVLQATLVQCRQTFGPMSAPVVAAQATKLGLADLAKRLQPPTAVNNSRGITGPAAFATRGSSSSSGSSAKATVERMTKLISEKKYEAGAREALQILRNERNPYNYSGEDLQNLKQQLGEDGTKELLKLVDPGESKSLVKRLEYADVCGRLGMKDAMVATLVKLNEERPDDSAVAARLAFSLPVEKMADRIRLMNAAAAGDEFVNQAAELAEQFENRESNAKVPIDFYDGVASWLEQADPKVFEKVNLTWVGYYGKEFFGGMYRPGLPNLMASVNNDDDEEEKPKNGKKTDKQLLLERRQAVAKRLALVMLKFPTLSEEGFRLLSCAKCWTIPDGEMDEHARQALALGDKDGTRAGYAGRYFVLMRGNGGSSSGEDLSERSSVKWIVSRLGKVKSPDEVLPPAYLEDLKKKNRAKGELLAALASLKTADELAKLWESDAISSAQEGALLMLRQGVVARAASIPGASSFFLKTVGKLKPGSVEYGYGEGSKEQVLLQAALIAAGVTEKEQDREALCLAIKKALFGEKVDWDQPADTQKLVNKSEMMGQMLRAERMEPQAAARLCRTLYRLKIPVGSGDYAITEHFQRGYLKTVEEAETYLDSLGCLSEVEDWSPMGVWTVRWEGGSRNQKANLQETLLQNRLFGSTGFSSSDLVKRLKERKKGRFGSLMYAASMASSSEKESLVLQAFTESQAAIAKMPESKLANFTLVVGAMKPDSIAKLPPALRGKFKGVEEKRRTDLLKQAETFLSNKAPSSQGSYASMRMGGSDSLFLQLLPLDENKALEVFLESERRYTTALSQGARVSRSSYNGYELSDRDTMLASLFESGRQSSFGSGGQGAAPEVDGMLRFLKKVQLAPEGGRFSYSPRYDDDSFEPMSRIGNVLITAAMEDKSKASQPEMQRFIEAALARDASLRADALVAVVCAQLDANRYRSKNVVEERAKLEPLKAALGANFRYCTLTYGLQRWKDDDAETRKATTEALCGVLADATLRASVKRSLAFRALVRAPELLDDPAAADAIAGLYESYCDEERSAVNGWSGALFAKLARYETNEAGKAVAKRFSDTFWKNAQASKAGGHAPIPSSLAGNLMVVAARTGDMVTAKRLFSQTQGAMTGNVRVISSMIATGQYDLAKLLLPPRGVLYPNEQQGSVFYTKALEEHLPAFLAQLPDSEAGLRLEAKFLSLAEPEGNEAPKESKVVRSERIAKSYTERRPKDRVTQLEVLYTLLKSNRLVLPLLGDELEVWSKDLDYKSSIAQWEASYDMKVNGLSRYVLTPMEGEVFGSAAMAGMLKGDTTMLEKITAALQEVPVLEKSSSYPYHGGTTHILRSCQTDLMDRSAFWLWYAVANGQTSGFAKALDSFEKLALNAEKRFEFVQDELNSGFSICHFLSLWNGQPKRFDALKEKMTTRQDMVKKYQMRAGLAPFAYSGARFDAWKNARFKPMRKKAVEDLFANPALAPMVSRDGGWVEQLSTSVPAEQLNEIALLPDEKFIPEVRPALFEYRGKQMASAKKPDESVTAFKRSIAATPATPEWDNIRGAVKVEMAEVLVSQGKKDEAKEIIAGMPVKEVGEWIKGRYKKIAPTLGVTDVTDPKAQPKPAPTEKKDG
ncbi:MAG: tetratricopeptide repeat protein [Luteolibacter sp.]